MKICNKARRWNEKSRHSWRKWLVLSRANLFSLLLSCTDKPQKSHKLVWEKLFLLAEFWFCVFSLWKVKPTQWPTQLPVFGISLSLVISPGEWVNVPVSVTYRVLLSIIIDGRDLISISLIMLFKHVTWIFFHLSYVSSFVKTQISLFFLLFSPFPLLRLYWARQQNAKTWNWKDCLWSYKKGIL